MDLCKEYSNVNCNEMKELISESFDLDCRLNLPQYLDDIDKLIKCCVTNSVSDYKLSDSGITVYGKSLIAIMYKSAHGLVLSNIFEEEFSKTFELQNTDSPSFADVAVTCAYSSSRLVNQRRIDVHIALNGTVAVYEKSGGNMLSSCRNAFVKQIESNALSELFAGICQCDFDESFTAAEDDVQIKNIINTYLKSTLDDRKIIKEKMLVKFKCELSVVYIDENDALQKCVHVFSVSKIIDIPDCEENDYALISAQTSQLYIKPKTDGKNRLCDIEAVGRISVNYKICRVCKQAFTVDFYIPRCNSSAEKKSVALKSNPAYFFDSKSLELDFDNEKNIVEIIDLSCEIVKCTVASSEIKLVCALRYFYYDDSSRLCYFEKEQACSLRLADSAADGEARVQITSFDYLIADVNKINLRLNIEYAAFLYEEKTIEYIADISASEKENEAAAPCITLYFADKNEDVWDIAKKFSTDKRLIIDENNLTSDIIDAKRVLLVPGM